MRQFVRAASLSNYLEVAAQVGLDPQAMLKAAGIDRRAFSDPDLRLPVDDVAILLEHSAAASGCESFGIRMAESRRLSDFGAISLLLAHQPTVRDALLTLVEHRQLLNPALMVNVEEFEDIVVVSERLQISASEHPRQSYELAVGVMHRLFRALLGARWRALSINFSHQAPADLSVHWRVFGPIVQFGSDFDGLTCSPRDLDNPNPSADPALARHAERYLRTLPNAAATSAAQEVRKAVYLLLPSGAATIQGVADTLGLNARTLQRRLEAEDRTFGEVLNEVRLELAPRYVASPDLPLARAAALLGYSRQSSFNRWFAEAFGSAPGEARRRTEV